MQFLKQIYRSLLHADPPPAAIFRLVYRQREQINLSFIDKQRLLRNISCHIQAIRANTLLLDFPDPLSANLFNMEKCHLYFKLPNELLRDKLHIRRNPEQNGFLCKSNIIEFGHADSSGKVRQISVRMPQKYVRRELRRHVRYNVFSGMISDAWLWLMPLENFDATLPLQPEEKNATGKSYPLSLEDISAGGAKAIIDNVDFQDEFAALDNYCLLLGIAFNSDNDEKQETWLSCRCVKSNYSINLRRFSLRLEFISPLAGGFMPSVSTLHKSDFLE